MITQLKEIVQQANPDYHVHFEESAMMNIFADDVRRDEGFAYIEEYTTGRYTKEKYFHQKITRVQIYFCRFCELHAGAEAREEVREKIETEIVLPFMAAFNTSGFEQVKIFEFFTPLPRFDANEVSIMLRFDLIHQLC